MHYVWFALIAGIFIALMWWANRPVGKSANETVQFDDLTAGERHVQQIIREVHGDAIVGERFVSEQGEVRVQLALDPAQSKVTDLSVSLTNLARKQQNEGLSDAALKAALTF